MDMVILPRFLPRTVRATGGACGGGSAGAGGQIRGEEGGYFTLISISRGLTSSRLGTVTRRTPFLNSAVTFSPLASFGRVKLRWKVPWVRSTRWNFTPSDL